MEPDLTPSTDTHRTALAALFEEATIRSYPKKSILIMEGDSGGGMFLILSGRVKVYASDEHGKELAIATCGPGEIVGEMALDGKPRCASVVATETTRCALISHAILREQLRANPDLALEIINLLISRGRNAVATAKELALANVYNRVTRLLTELGEPDEKGRLVVREQLSQQDIAHRVGSSRDMVNRVFKELVKGGYLEVNRREIIILKRFPADW